MNTELIPVASKAIAAVGYDGYTLTIEFTSGRIYDHPGVPPSVFRELMNAPSIGRYYSKCIRGRYK